MHVHYYGQTVYYVGSFGANAVAKRFVHARADARVRAWRGQ